MYLAQIVHVLEYHIGHNKDLILPKMPNFDQLLLIFHGATKMLATLFADV